MGSESSYTKIVEVECLEGQKEGPQVVTSRMVGKVRGFFIMVAALSLTILIGLVVVVVIKDINDEPRRNGYYGHSSEIAQHGGCRSVVWSFDWLRPDCGSAEPVEKFRNFGPGAWFTDVDLSETSDEACNRGQFPAEGEGRP